MKEVITIELPKGTSQSDIKDVENELKSITQVKATGSGPSRGLDPGTLTVWISLAVSLIDLADKAVPILQKVIEAVRGKGVKGAKLKLASGEELATDEASAKDIERIVKSTSSKPL